jgi:hypothetical protein
MREAPPGSESDEPERGSVDRARVKHLRRHELDTAYRLADLGHHIVFRPATGEGHEPDVNIDGATWELKSPTGASVNAVTRNVRGGADQSRRVVIDISRSPLTPDRARVGAQIALDRYPGLIGTGWLIGKGLNERMGGG